jgi:hypothetical protein
MEQTTHPASAQQSQKDLLEVQIRDCFGRAAYTHKTHEKCADRLLSRLAIVKGCQIVLSAVTTAGLVGVIFGGAELTRIAAIISAVTSVVLTALNLYTKESDPGQKAERHKEVAADLWDVREHYLSLLTDLRSGVPEVKIREVRDRLQERLAAIYKNAPRTDDKAYRRAQDGLKHKEELTFSDEELNKLLPPTLHR